MPPFLLGPTQKSTFILGSGVTSRLEPHAAATWLPFDRSDRKKEIQQLSYPYYTFPFHQARPSYCSSFMHEHCLQSPSPVITKNLLILFLPALHANTSLCKAHMFLRPPDIIQQVHLPNTSPSFCRYPMFRKPPLPFPLCPLVHMMGSSSH